MIADFIPPENPNVFYGKQSHEEFCNLCDKQGIPEDERLELAEKMGFGFGYAYVCELKKARASYEVRGVLDRADGKYHRYDEALKLAQQHLGGKLVSAMTPYLIKHNGKVDCWPSPVYGDMLSVPLTSKNYERYYDEEEEEWVIKNEEKISDYMTVPFHYFGGAYTQHVKTTRRTSSDLVSDSTTTNSVWSMEQEPGAYYQTYGYSLKGSEEYHTLIVRQASLEGKYEDAREEKVKQRGNHTKLAFVYLPVAITVVIALLALFWTFTGTDGLEEAVNKVTLLAWLDNAARGDGILKIIAFIPAFFIKIAAVCWYLLALIGSLLKMEKITVVLGLGLLVCGGILVAGMLDELIKPNHDKIITRKEWREARKAKKEAKQLVNSAKYKKASEEYHKMLHEYEEYAEMWTKSWFEAWKANID